MLLRSGNPFILTVCLGFLSFTSSVVIPIQNTVSIENGCSKGPEHWCINIFNAKECHATKHCMQTVWERQTVAEDSDSICDICKEMVQEARDQLISNETQEELQQVFEGSCNLMPIKLVRMQCIKLVDDFIPELTEMLSSQMNPTMVCSVAGLCNNEWADKLQFEYQTVQELETVFVDNSEECSYCNKHKDTISNKMLSFSSNDLLNILFNMCGKMNSYSDACSSIVANNIENIHQMIKELFVQKDMCQTTGFCRKSEQVSVEIVPKSNDKKLMRKTGEDIQCEFCEALVVHLRDILVSNTTESQFKQVLTSLCKLSGSFAEECLSLANEYYDVAYSFLLNELDPKATCTVLTLCDSMKDAGVKQHGLFSYIKYQPASSNVKATELTPAKKISELSENESAVEVVKAVELVPAKTTSQSSENVSNNPGCILCEFVLREIVSDLQNATIEAEVKQALESVCSKLPSAIEDQCKTLVETYGDAILFLVVQEIDPSTVCTTIKLCSAANEFIVLPVNPFTSQKPQDPNACALCEFVVTELVDRVKDEKTEATIRKELEAICAYLPKSVTKDCTRLVDAYTEEVIEMILADLTPDEVCASLKLCSPKPRKSDITLGDFLVKLTKESEVKLAVDENSVKPAATCVMCEYAMAQLDKKILNNKTEEEMKRMIDFMCAHLPDTVADMCIDFIEEHGDQIFDMLVAQMDPKEICTQLGLCQTTSAQLAIEDQKNPIFQENVEVDLWGPCDTCKVVVEYLDKLLEDDTIEESIDKILEKACLIVPKKSRDQCKTIVDTYGPYLLSEMGEMMDKTKVCQTVHLCKPPPGHVQLLGGQKCTWGPTYWCASQQHADACNALSHCQTKVWMKSAP